MAELSRRHLVAAAVGLALGSALGPVAGHAAAAGCTAGNGQTAAGLAGPHCPALRLPRATVNGPRVPIVVELAHPMTPAHYIRSIEVINGRDPVSSKGVFHFTPANGQAYVAFQARLDEGASEVAATAECSRDGRFTTVRPITIPAGRGGCAAKHDPAGASDDEILPPRIRIAQLVRRGRIEPGELLDVQVEIRHPSRPGLERRDGRFVRVAEPFYLTELLVGYGGTSVSRFDMTPAISDNPLITFRLLAAHEGEITVALTNSRGRRFHAEHPVRLS